MKLERTRFNVVVDTAVDSSSAARKVDTKVAKLLIKVAQKVATHKKPVYNRFKTRFQPRLGFSRFKKLHLRLYVRAGSKPV